MTDASNAHDRQLLLDLFEDLANSEPEPLAEVYPSQNVMHWGCSNVLDTGFTESNAVHMRGQQAAVGNLVYRQQSKKKRIRVREAGQVRALEDQLQLVQKTLQSVSAKNEALRDRHALFERLVHVRSQQLHFVSTTEQQPMPAAQLREPVRPEHVDQPIYHLLCRHALDQNEQLRFSRMSRQEFAGQWKAYMSEASSCLLALGCGMDSTMACATGSRGSAQTATEAVPGPSCMSAAAACRLVELNIAIDYTARNFSLQNPQAFESVLTQDLETSESRHDPVPADYWHNILSHMALTAQQRADLAAVHGVYAAGMQKLQAERVQLKAHLASSHTLRHGTNSAPPPPSTCLAAGHSSACAGLSVSGPNTHSSLGAGQGQASLGQCDGSSASQPQLLQVCAEELVLERLARSIRREQSMHTLLRGVLFGFTLTPRQFFTLGVNCYPVFPDATAIVSAVASSCSTAGGAAGM